MYKRGIMLLVAVAIIICAVAVVAYFIGGAHQRFIGRTGPESGTAAAVNSKIAGGQQRTIELNQRAVEFAEAIRGITEEANRSYAELGELNRRSSNISAQIRAENKLLADYFRRVSNVVSDYSDNMGSE